MDVVFQDADNTIVAAVTIVGIFDDLEWHVPWRNPGQRGEALKEALVGVVAYEAAARAGFYRGAGS